MKKGENKMKETKSPMGKFEHPFLLNLEEGISYMVPFDYHDINDLYRGIISNYTQYIREINRNE